MQETEKPPIQWILCLPFLLLHVACLTVFLVGWSWPAVLVAVVLYAVRMFGITGFYHRYFSHRSFKTSRWFQLVGAVIGNAAVQHGPIWWAAHHRHHHRHSDTEEDIHSPVVQGFWRSHMGWFLTEEAFGTEERAVRDLLKFPELRFLERFDLLIPILLGVSLFGLGVLLNTQYPQLGTGGWQMFVWGFLISTVAVYHATYSINSLAHVFGRRRFSTKDDSRNNFWLALATFGEGWHNNHHHYPGSTRQGFYWWEIDLTYYILVVFSWFGLVWDIRPVPERVLAEGRRTSESTTPAE